MASLLSGGACIISDYASFHTYPRYLKISLGTLSSIFLWFKTRWLVLRTKLLKWYKTFENAIKVIKSTETTSSLSSLASPQMTENQSIRPSIQNSLGIQSFVYHGAKFRFLTKIMNWVGFANIVDQVSFNKICNLIWCPWNGYWRQPCLLSESIFLDIGFALVSYSLLNVKSWNLRNRHIWKFCCAIIGELHRVIADNLQNTDLY